MGNDMSKKDIAQSMEEADEILKLLKEKSSVIEEIPLLNSTEITVAEEVQTATEGEAEVKATELEELRSLLQQREAEMEQMSKMLKEKLNDLRAEVVNEQTNATESDFERKCAETSNMVWINDLSSQLKNSEAEKKELFKMLEEQRRQFDSKMEMEKAKLKEEAKGGKRMRFYSIPEVVSVLPKFNPESALSIEDWVRKIENYVKIYGIEEDVLRMSLKSLMAGSAEEWFAAHIEPEEDWDVVKVKLENDFHRQTSVLKTVEKMGATRRKQGQSLVQYFVTMEALADKKLSEDDLVTLILRGSRCKRLEEIEKSGIRMKRADLWVQIRNMEEEEDEVEERQKYQVAVERPRVQRRVEEQNGWQGMQGRQIGPKCYNCARYGHIERNCSEASGVNCYNCKKPGHTADKCGSRVICHFCGKSGHVQFECELRKVQHEQQERGAAKGVAEVKRSRAIRFANDESREGGVNQLERRLVVSEDSRVRARAEVGGKQQEWDTIVDTGSSVSALNISKLNLNACEGLVLEKNIDCNIRGVNHSKVEVLGKLNAKVDIDGSEYGVEFLIVPEKTMPDDAILGIDFLKRNNIKNIGFGKEKYISRKRIRRMEEVEGTWSRERYFRKKKGVREAGR